MPKLKKRELTATEINELVNQYNVLREQESVIKKQKELIAGKIKDYATVNGSQDSKGSYYVQTDDFIFGKQARTSVKFNQQKAVELLTERDLTQAIATQIIKTVDEVVFEQLVLDEEINTDEFTEQGGIEVSTTYAIFVKAVSDMTPDEKAEFGA